MNAGFIAALFVMVILTVFTFIILHLIAVNATDKIRDNVVNQINSYDTLIQKKEAELQALNMQIEDKSKNLINEKQEDIHSSQTPSEINTIADAVYRNDDFSQDYRNLKDQFKFDRFKIIKDIYDEYNNQRNQMSNELLDGLIDKFSLKNVYKISAFKSIEQLEIIEELLTKEEKIYVDEYIKQNRVFNCLSFYHWLYMKRELNNNLLLVRTAEVNENYDNIGDLLLTRYDEGLCEGMQIYVGNKLYDYGIRKYELIS